MTSGRWFVTSWGVPGSNGLSLNVPCLHPLFPSVSGTITDIAFEVTSASTSGFMRVGLYADSGGSPGALIADWGTVSTGTTGVKTITGLSQALVAGNLYWLCMVPQTSTCNIRVTTGFNPYVGSTAATPTLNAGSNFGAYAYGAMAGALGALGAIVNNVYSPAFAIRFA